MGRRFSYGPQGPGLDLQQCNKEGRESEGGCRVDGGESSLEEEEEETEKERTSRRKQEVRKMPRLLRCPPSKHKDLSLDTQIQVRS